MERRKRQEKKVSRKEMPTYKDAKRKRHQWKAAEKTSVSRDSDDIRKVRREECVKSRASELSTRRAVKIQRCQEQAGSRESGSTRQGC
jgi:hypothetical protein